MDPPPTFRAEIYYLIAKFLENGPCQASAQALRKDLESHELVPSRYDWKGQKHQKTFKDMEDQFGPLPDEFLLRKCFDLCTKLNPGSVRSLLQKESKTCLKSDNFLQRFGRQQIGTQETKAYQTSWHAQLAKNMKLLRRTFGHLSSVYCLIFDQSGKLVLTGADDMLVKCWSFIDGRLIHTFRGASSEISDLAVSQDNKLLAAGSCDRVIRVWELHTACPVAVLTKHTGTITAINFCPYLLSPDKSKFLASTSGDGTVSFWRYKYDEHGHTEFESAPTRYHEKIRPGSTQMICASFSPGGVFFCVGSADHNVRVYKMNGPEGPIRILEEEFHDDRVDSIQWCNTPHELRFLSGSRDGTARIWSYSHQRWSTLVLNMKTEDNSEPTKANPKVNPQPPTSTSRAGRTIAAQVDNNDSNNGENNIQANNKKMKSVTMVAWSLDDALAITAVSDLTLKIWDSHKGTLMSTLTGHEDEIFVLEPHPLNLNLLLTAAHDGHIMVWDLETKQMLFKHRNMINEQGSGQTQGHGPVFDAKWSKDGTTICASDSHGHILFIGNGNSDRYSKCPNELFFHTDYRPLLRDSFHNVVDEQTQLPPHLLPPPFLVDSEGDPYPPFIQKLVRGRENVTELVPIGPEPSFQAPHQHMEVEEPEEEEPAEPANQNPEQRLEQFRNEMLRNLPNNQAQNERGQDNQENNDAEQEDNNETHAARTTKLVILKEKSCQAEIHEKVQKVETASALEANLYVTETNKDGLFEHDYARPSANKAKQKSRKDPRSRSRQVEVEQQDDDDEEETEEQNENEQNANENENSDSSALDESDFSSADSTTDVSSEHSDWGSDHSNQKEENPARVSSRTKSSPNKAAKAKKRHAAQKCREKMSLPNGDLSAFMPSPWLSETIPRKTPYFPQIGDVLMYFKGGHERYIELVEIRKAYKLNMREQQWKRKRNVEESTMVKVLDIKFEIRPPRLCVLRLSILNQGTSKPTGETFTIKYHDMNDVVDFLVLYQAFNSHKGKHWKKGDRIRCQIDDCWWKGTVQKVENKESPFLSIFVHWDNGDKEYLSPWDLEFLDNDTDDIKDGAAVPEDQLKKSLYIPNSEEWNNIGRESESTRISEAMASIMELAIAEPFNYPVDLTVYPEYMVDVEYPMDLNLIKTRVENHFYRRIDAIKHDLKYIFTNAASFNRPRSDIVRNSKIISKLVSEIVGDTSKTKEDVSQMYHRLVESFEWSESDSDDDEDEDEDGAAESDNEEDDPEEKSSRSRRKKKYGSSPQNLNPKKWKHDCNELLTEMTKLPFSAPFREPVSEIDFPDYSRFVTTPMDLSSVRESLHIGDYNSPMDFQKDIRLIFKNSKEYNTNPKSKVLSLTLKLEEWFEQRIGSLVNSFRSTLRRLATAKKKHKMKKQENSPDYKGKGKGKGKGQSNKIRNSRKDSSAESESEDEDFSSPKPGPSKIVKKSVPSTAAPPLRNAMTEANAGRRTSSRQSRPPLRFQENSGDDEDDEMASTSQVKKEDSDDEEVPLARKAATSKASRVVVKEESEEDEPLVKRATKKKLKPSSDEEDVPLASRRRGQITSPPPNTASSSKSLSSKKSPSKRPSRPPRRYEETESEEESPVQRRSSRSSKKAKKRSKNKRNSDRPRRMPARKRARYESASEDDDDSEDSEEDSEASDDAESEPELPRKRGVSHRSRARVVVDPESEEEILPQRKRRQFMERSRLRRESSSPNAPLPRRRNVNRPTYAEEESGEEDNRRSRRSRRKRQETPEPEPESEDESGDSSEEGEEDSEEDSDGNESTSREKAYLSKKKKKATVTSRGRVSKPNPRII